MLLAAVLTSVIVLLSAERTLRAEVDDSLRDRLQVVLGPIRTDTLGSGLGIRLPRLGAAGGHTQLITRSGATRVLSGGDEPIPPSDAAVQIAASGGPSLFETVEVDGIKVRLLTAGGRPGVAVQVARPLDEIDNSIAQLRRLLVVIMLGATAFAGMVAFGSLHTVMAPLNALAKTVDGIRRTGDLTARVEVHGSDEVGVLASRFNEMLTTLEGSVGAQRNLIADVSHELRTPLTSLRTNVEVLRRADGLSTQDRDRLGRDIDMQIDELSKLIRDVIDLGRDQGPGIVKAAVALDEIAQVQAELAQSHWPGVSFQLELRPTSVQGDDEMIARAVQNLLDNAAKHGATAVTLEVRDGEVIVSDNGPGIDAEHLPHVFDRFWRAPGARSKPGSGLGLAIVAQVARDHGGLVRVESTPTATTFHLIFPDQILPSS